VLVEMIWLQQYPKGMPAEVDVRAHASLADLLRHSCERFAKLPAYSSMGVVVNVNSQYTAPELAHQLRDSVAAAIVVLENFAHTLQMVMDRDPALRPVVITTEVAKGAVLTHGNLVTSAGGMAVQHVVAERWPSSWTIRGGSCQLAKSARLACAGPG
jgi:acyl-CoA synthetase (AMP-forming)/AMP-acid ligase II